MKHCLTAAIALSAALVAQVPPARPTPDAPVPPQGQAPGQTAPQTGNAWFSVTERTCDVEPGAEAATGKFPFKNPTGKEVQWRHVQGSCTCTRAMIHVADRTYEMQSKPELKLFLVVKSGEATERREVPAIPVGAEESGDIEMHMDMHGITGRKEATLDIHTDDTTNPQMKLKLAGIGVQLFAVSPPDVNLGNMAWTERKEFTVSVTSPVQKDFNITRMEPAGKDLSASFEKATRDGVATWTIHGVYGPLTTETGEGGTLRFFTDVHNGSAFSVRVTATVKSAMEVKPGFLMLGLVKRGSPKTEKVVFEPNDGHDLQATKVHIENLTVPEKFVTTRTSKDGLKLVVEVEISGDAPVGLVRGDLIVDLNHPSIPQKKILFNGFVR